MASASTQKPRRRLQPIPREAIGDLLTAALLSFSASICAASNDYATMLEAATERLPSGSLVAAVIRDQHGNDLLSVNAGQLLTPASTLKILTATAAHYQLGSQFRFRTTVDRTRDNDVVVRFSGDPLLTRDELRALLARALDNGMPANIRNLYLDDSHFSGHDWSDAQSWDNRNTCFAAPAAAVSLDHNCFKATIGAGRIGDTARASVSDDLPLAIGSQAKIVSAEEKKRLFCGPQLHHLNRGRYQLHGCVTPAQLPLTLKVAIVDPLHYVRNAIGEDAAALGVAIEGSILRGSPERQSEVLAEHRSRSLGHYLDRLLQRSDNQVADALFKTIGQSYYRVPGNYRNGAAAVRAVLLDKAGINLDNSYLADGSGLSPHNQITVGNLVDTLTHIASMPGGEILDALPVAGISGTLRYRYGFDKQPLKGNVRAKTGHLAGHYNLAGYLTDSQQQTLSFSVFVSGYSITAERDSKLAEPNRHVAYFYHSLFTALHRHQHRVAAVEHHETDAGLHRQ